MDHIIIYLVGKAWEGRYYFNNQILEDKFLSCVHDNLVFNFQIYVYFFFGDFKETCSFTISIKYGHLLEKLTKYGHLLETLTV